MRGLLVVLMLGGCVSTDRAAGYEEARQRALTPAERDVLAAEAEQRQAAQRESVCDPEHANKDYGHAMECGRYYAEERDPTNAIWWWRVAFRISADRHEACPPVLAILHWSKQPGQDLADVDPMLPAQCRQVIHSCRDECDAEVNACRAAEEPQACMRRLAEPPDCFARCMAR